MPAKKSVLLVEDNKLLRDTLRKILEEHDFEVAEAASTHEALKGLERGAFDLVFSDNSFPKFADSRDGPIRDQGLELLKWMRFEKKYESTPFILHTGDTAMLATEVEKLKGILLPKGQTTPKIIEVVRGALEEKMPA